MASYQQRLWLVTDRHYSLISAACPECAATEAALKDVRSRLKGVPPVVHLRGPVVSLRRR